MTFVCVFNSHPRVCLLILEREEGVGVDLGGVGGEREINWLPPIHVLTKDGTHNLLVYGMMLQPTEPPGQGRNIFLRLQGPKPGLLSNLPGRGSQLPAQRPSALPADLPPCISWVKEAASRGSCVRLGADGAWAMFTFLFFV